MSLLTGDARGDKILEGLELVNLMEKGGTVHVDVLKVPHHGSAHNLEDDFFRRITADHYVFSGNGEHSNPERESFEMLMRARPDADYTIHLTYPIDEIDRESKKEWEEAQNTARKRKEENPHKNVKVKDDWSPEKQSLQALFDEHPAFRERVSIVEKNEPHVINLLGELGF